MTGTSLRSWTPWLVTLHLLICCAPTVEARQSDDALENSYKTSVIQELTEKALTLADLYKLSQNKSDREKINKLYDQLRLSPRDGAASLKLGLLIHQRIYQDVLTTYTNNTNKSSETAFANPSSQQEISEISTSNSKPVLSYDQIHSAAAEQAEQERSKTCC